MTDPTEAIRKALEAFAAFPSATTLSALHLACKPSALGALLDRLDSAERKLSELQFIGGKLANIAYNMAQTEGRPMPGHVCKSMDEARKQWDAALRSVGEKEPK